MWIYVLGERDGADIKIGHTAKPTVLGRVAEIEGQTTRNESYVMLAGMLGSTQAETAMKDYFEPYRRKDKGRNKEYFWPVEELIEYVLWLRQQWWVSFDGTQEQKDSPEEHHSAWIPNAQRRVARPPIDDTQMFQPYEQQQGPLSKSSWRWMPDQMASFQDYFTDPRLVRMSSEAMDGIDLDAASHWIANRRLHDAGVEIGDYYTPTRSAFTHPWGDKTFLNPPYGENDRWFKRAIEQMEDGNTSQLCMLSPVYAFTTRIAEEIMFRSSSAILLSPTPKFYNPAFPSGRDEATGKSKDGTNLPHAIVYWGDRREYFLRAFDGTGIPFMVAYEYLRGGVPV